MSDIPIIFSGPMVSALLDGRKTQTRRLAWRATGSFVGEGPAKPGYKVIYSNVGSTPVPLQYAPSPWQRVKAGDLLWVREAHYVECAGYLDGTGQRILYRANDPDAPCTWTPGIHMARFASRLTLECTAGARVEPLQAISREDAFAEGATEKPNCTGFQSKQPGWSMDWREPYEDHALGDPTMAFANFINQLHGGPRWNLKPTNLWAENPDVVALTFKVHTANIDAFKAQRQAA